MDEARRRFNRMAAGLAGLAAAPGLLAQGDPAAD